MSKQVLVIADVHHSINVNDKIEGESLAAALKESFPLMTGYVELVCDLLKLWEAGKAVAQSEELTDQQYIECFYNWYDAVTGCGVEPEATKEFHELLDIAITEFDMW
ncbi:hypothetical protein VP168E361_P0066 [Vibrio phage 168E36-1]|nr:hypothetical protein VP168E361_P0066 [Vibrio phage 168E36-1]